MEEKVGWSMVGEDIEVEEEEEEVEEEESAVG